MLVHPIFKVLLRRPHLLAAHAAGYAALLEEEAGSAGRLLTRQALAWASALLAFVVFLMLTGVAAMLMALWGQWHWVLAAAPLTALALAFVAWQLARQGMATSALGALREQIDADADALRVLGSS